MKAQYKGIHIYFLLLVGVFFLLYGVVLGYGLRVDQDVYEVSKATQASTLKQGKVLGVAIHEQYINPFDVVDAKEIEFPILQLRSCRNWSECQQVCSQPEHFQACAAWYRSVE